MTKALAIVVRKNDDAQRKLNELMRLVDVWMREHELKLATQRTEITLLTHHQVPTEIDASFDPDELSLYL